MNEFSKFSELQDLLNMDVPSETGKAKLPLSTMHKVTPSYSSRKWVKRQKKVICKSCCMIPHRKYAKLHSMLPTRQPAFAKVYRFKNSSISCNHSVYTLQMWTLLLTNCLTNASVTWIPLTITRRIDYLHYQVGLQMFS